MNYLFQSSSLTPQKRRVFFYVHLAPRVDSKLRAEAAKKKSLRDELVEETKVFFVVVVVFKAALSSRLGVVSVQLSSLRRAALSQMSRRQDFNPRLVQRNVRGLARPLRGRLESEALFALGRYRDRADVGNRFETIWRRLRRVRDERTKRVSRRRTRRMASADEKTRLGEDGRTDGRRGENKSDDAE